MRSFLVNLQLSRVCICATKEAEIIGHLMPHQMRHGECDDGLFAALDCIGEESDEYWEEMAEKKNQRI